MESLQTTKNRLKAVKNVGQITKAMEVVAATKMRRAQETALNSRPYAYEAMELLSRLVCNAKFELPLSLSRPIKKTLVLVVASDRGLAGSFNGQVFKMADLFFARDEYSKQTDHQFVISAVGKKAVAYGNKKSYALARSFDNASDITEPSAVAEIGSFLVEGFLRGDWDRVVTVSTHFRTALKQEPVVRQILPLSVEKIKETIKQIVPERGRYSGLNAAASATEEKAKNDRVSRSSAGAEWEYIFEPSPREVAEALIPHLVTMQIYHLFLEAKASEHSARRVAMKTASDNAIELGDTLTMEYNRARQMGITRELAEITTTIMTLE